jgi:hypothetical protein
MAEPAYDYNYFADNDDESFEIPDGGIADFLIARTGSWATPDFETPTSGIGSVKNIGDHLAEFGRFDDEYMAHLAPNETVVPAAVLDLNPRLKAALHGQMRAAGIDPARYTVGDDANSINPVTGQREFGFLDDLIFRPIKRGIKKVVNVVKRALPVILPIALSFTPLGPVLGSMVGSGIGSLLQGGDLKSALKAAAVSGVTAGIFRGIQGGVRGVKEGTGFFQGAGETLRGDLSNVGARFSQTLGGTRPPGTPYFGSPGRTIESVDDAATRAMTESPLPSKAPSASVNYGQGTAAPRPGQGVGGPPTTGPAGVRTPLPPATDYGYGAVTDYGLDLPEEAFGGLSLPDAPVRPSIQVEYARPPHGPGSEGYAQRQIDALSATRGTSTAGTSTAGTSTAGTSTAGTSTAGTSTAGTGTGDSSTAPLPVDYFDDYAQKPPGFFESIKGALTPGDDGVGFFEGLGDAFFPTADKSAIKEALEGNQNYQNLRYIDKRKVLNDLVRDSAPGFLRRWAPLLGLGMLATAAQPPVQQPQFTPISGTEYVNPIDVMEAEPERYRFAQALPPTSTIVQQAGTGVGPRPTIQFGAHGGAIEQDFPPRIGAIAGPGTGTSDDVPAMLSDGEFVFTSKAVRGAGNGSRTQGNQTLYSLMRNFENRA